MLFASGAIERLGSVDDGTTASDYDRIEIERHMSINLSLLPQEWKGTKFLCYLNTVLIHCELWIKHFI